MAKKISREGFLEIHWDKIIPILLFVIPSIYFLKFLSPNQMIGGSDYLIGSYPLEKYAKEQGEIPLWFPNVFGGFPALGAPVGGEFAPLAQLKWILPPQIVLTIKFIILFFIAGLGMFFYLKTLGLSKYSSGFGAFVYQWIGNLATTPEAGHAGRAASIALFPFILFFLHRALDTKKVNHFILLSIAIAFTFYEGHFQLTYYTLIVLVVYVVHYLVIHRKILTKKDLVKILGYGFICIILIFLLMAMVWLPVLGGMKAVARGLERGYEYAASWNLPPVEIFDLFVPNFSGGLENYWGENAFKLHTEFCGIVIIIFLLFALILFFKKNYVKFFAITGLVALFYCFGGATPVHRIFYTIIPGFKLMRAPNLAFYIVAFSMVIIGATGFEELIIKKEIDKKKFLTISGILIFILLVVLSLIAPAIGRAAAGEKIGNFEQNISGYTTSATISFILLLFVIISVYFRISGKLKISSASLLIIILSLIHQIPVMAKYLPEAPAPEVYYRADDIVPFLKRDKTIFRVFPFYYEHTTDCYLYYHNIQSAGGYIANPIQRYQDFIGAGTSVMFNPSNLIKYPKFIDLLNLKYVVAPNLPDDISRYDPHSQRLIMQIKEFLKRFRLVHRGYKSSVYQNDSVLPRAYLVPDYCVVEENQILEIMKSENFDPKRIVILEEEPDLPHQPEVNSFYEAEIIEYRANRIVCRADCPFAGFLVLLDNWHPDWRVYVDGKEAKLYRANYTFRAVYLEAGRHDVVFEYKSKFFVIGLIITITTIFAILGFYIPLGIWRQAVRIRLKSQSR
uniref:YfhO family protein n=1 Tax=candidate division WOR-3 bacterium TaxID=2052148 RepID=A0A7C4TDF3_UNCW3